jgi:glycosyltransferase involved in cell wall biosynthesis
MKILQKELCSSKLSLVHKIMHPELREPLISQDISVVIPAHNAATCIVECLDSVLQQNKKPKEIIVVDDGSIDSTYSTMRNLSSEIIGVQTAHYGVAAARNIGIQHASGDIIVFIDADCIAHPNWLEKIQEPFNSGIDIVQGNIWAQYWQNKITSYHALWRKSVFLQKTKFHDCQLNTFVTRNVALKRSVIERAREYYGHIFDERLMGAEDRELGYRLFRLGTKIILEESAVVRHKDPSTLLGIMKQKYRHALFDVDAGIAERLFDFENFKRAVLIPSKHGVPIHFSFLLWLAHIYGCEYGRLRKKAM